MSATTATKLQVINAALAYIGAPRLVDLAGTDKVTLLVNENYGIVRQSLLHSHRWKWVKTPAKLTTSNLTGVKTVTAITQADPPVVTAVSHGFATGKYVILVDVVGMTQINGLKSIVTSLTSNTFSMDDLDSSGYSAYTSGGKAGLAPPVKYLYWHDLPSDCIAVNDIEELDIDYALQLNRVASFETSLELIYTADGSTESTWPALFAEVFSLALANRLCYALTQSSTVKQMIHREYQIAMAKARHADSLIEPPEQLSATDWLEARFNSRRYVRDPMTS